VAYVIQGMLFCTSAMLSDRQTADSAVQLQGRGQAWWSYGCVSGMCMWSFGVAGEVRFGVAGKLALVWG
jgi:hypothetical protein